MVSSVATVFGTGSAWPESQLGKPQPPLAGVVASAAEGVLVTGLPSVIERPRSLAAFLGDEPTCVDFRLRNIGSPAPSLRLATTGMREARLADMTGKSLTCPSGNGGGSPMLTLSNVGDDDRVVRIYLPDGAFPSLAGGSKAKLLILRPGLPTTEYAVILAREDYRPFERGLLWFFGFALPAFITAALALFGYRTQKNIDARSTESKVIKDFGRESREVLQGFFSEAGLYHNILKEQDWKTRMERELAAQRVLYVLPAKLLNSVTDALRREDRVGLCNALAKAFPEFRDAILASTKNKSTRARL